MMMDLLPGIAIYNSWTETRPRARRTSGPDPDFDALRQEAASDPDEWEADNSEIGRSWQVILARATVPCPSGCRPNGTLPAPVRILDVPQGTTLVEILLELPRFERVNPAETDAARTTTTARVPVIDHPRGMTCRLVRTIKEWASASTFSSVAARTGASEKAVSQIFYDFAKRVDKIFPHKAPRYLGIDDCHIGGEHYTVFVDLERGALIDMVDGIAGDAVAAFLRTLTHRKRVRAVAMDFAKPYAQAARTELKHARIVIDKRHILELTRRKMNAFRNELIKSSPENKSKLRDSYHVINEREDRVTDPVAKNILQEILETFKDSLGCVHTAREELCHIFDNRNQGEEAACVAILDWIEHWVEGNKAPLVTKGLLRSTAKTLKSRIDDVLGYFSSEADMGEGRRVTNAATEAINGVMKFMNSEARGFKDFDNLRLRALHRCGVRTWAESNIALGALGLINRQRNLPKSPPDPLLDVLRTARIGDALDEAHNKLMTRELDRANISARQLVARVKAARGRRR